MAMPVREARVFASTTGVPFGGDFKITDDSIRVERFSVRIDRDGNFAWLNRFTLPFERCVFLPNPYLLHVTEPGVAQGCNIPYSWSRRYQPEGKRHIRAVPARVRRDAFAAPPKAC